MGFANTAYSVAAGIGYFDAIVTLIMAGGFALILVVVAFVLFAKRNIMAGVICVIIAFMVMLLAYLYFYFVTSSKDVAAVAGTFAVANALIN